MSRRPVKRQQGEGLLIHLVSGDTVRLRPGEAPRVLMHRHIVLLYLFIWIALTFADPSGQAGSTPIDIRLPQYAAGVLVVGISCFTVFAVSDLVARRRGHVVALFDWPIVLVVSMLGLAASETTVYMLTGEMRISAKVFFVLSVFYFVIIEVNFQIIAWLMLPRILSDLRAAQVKPADMADTPAQNPAILRAGGHDIPPETVLHMEAQGNYVAIITDSAQYDVPGPFARLLDQMPDGFGLRVHRSHWVARRAVTGHRRKAREMLLDLTHGGTATVAIPRHGEVLDWLAQAGAMAKADRPRPENAAKQG